jgi:hypothetical protein
MHYPMFLIERLVFVMTPVLFPQIIIAQIIWLTSWKVGFIGFKLHSKPYDCSWIVYWLKIAVDVLHLCLYVFLYLFTDFIEDDMLKYNLGDIFIRINIMIIFTHVAILIQENIIEGGRFKVWYKHHFNPDPLEDE